jgi:hypothetical protein
MSDSPTPPATRRRPRRCNADYRWTVPKAWAFLEALARCGRVAEAARAVGMSRQAAYQLKARLAGGPLDGGFEIARRAGLKRRAARSVSRWAGPGLAAIAVPRQADTSGRKLTRPAPS